MRFATTLVMCTALLTANHAAGQSKASADPLTGTWTGSMGPDDTQQQTSLKVEMKYDGKTITGVVTGPRYPGDIRTGTFDGATGALKFEVVVRNESKSIVHFEGKVEKGAASGTVAFDDGQKGVFKMTKDAAGKQTGRRTPEQIQASEAHKGDFDYLLGDWEFTAESKEHGKFRGYWSAVRLEEGQILDEYRVVGDNAETYYVTTTLRNYNKFADRWELIGADAGGGLQDVGTGRRVGGEVHIEQKFGVASGTPSTWRIRYYNIKPDSFSWSADRSTDGGNTWVRTFQTIEARRIGTARSLGALAPARKGR